LNLLLRSDAEKKIHAIRQLQEEIDAEHKKCEERKAKLQSLNVSTTESQQRRLAALKAERKQMLIDTAGIEVTEDENELLKARVRAVSAEYNANTERQKKEINDREKAVFDTRMNLEQILQQVIKQKDDLLVTEAVRALTVPVSRVKGLLTSCPPTSLSSPRASTWTPTRSTRARRTTRCARPSTCGKSGASRCSRSSSRATTSSRACACSVPWYVCDVVCCVLCCLSLTFTARAHSKVADTMVFEDQNAAMLLRRKVRQERERNEVEERCQEIEAEIAMLRHQATYKEALAGQLQRLRVELTGVRKQRTKACRAATAYAHMLVGQSLAIAEKINPLNTLHSEKKAGTETPPTFASLAAEASAGPADPFFGGHHGHHGEVSVSAGVSLSTGFGDSGFYESLQVSCALPGAPRPPLLPCRSCLILPPATRHPPPAPRRSVMTCSPLPVLVAPCSLCRNPRSRRTRARAGTRAIPTLRDKS